MHERCTGLPLCSCHYASNNRFDNDSLLHRKPVEVAWKLEMMWSRRRTLDSCTKCTDCSFLCADSYVLLQLDRGRQEAVDGLDSACADSPLLRMSVVTPPVRSKLQRIPARCLSRIPRISITDRQTDIATGFHIASFAYIGGQKQKTEVDNKNVRDVCSQELVWEITA